MPDEDNIEAALTLKAACATYFANAIAPGTLRAEARKGNLVIMRIGRRDFVTPSAIREMQTKCRVEQKEPASGSTRGRASGLSETERRSAARDAALRSAEEQKQRFRRR